MSRTLARTLRRNRSNTFSLQITSMIDMFTIILVFLLKSYGTSAIQVTPFKGLSLPNSTAQLEPVEALKLTVSQDGVYVDEQLVVPLKAGSLESSFVDNKDPQFIRKLYDNLEEQAKKTKGISKQNETVQFDGKVIFQADQGLDYNLLRKVMYTSSIAGYADFKFAVVSRE